MPLSPPPRVAAAKQTAPPPSSAGKKYLGTVTLLTVISDKGYVCSTRVIRGISKDLNKKAEKAVQDWRFEPHRKMDTLYLWSSW